LPCKHFLFLFWFYLPLPLLLPSSSSTATISLYCYHLSLLLPSPSFFGTQNDFGHNTVITLMANIIVGIPVQTASGAGIRPYLTGGVGLMVFFGSHVGLRGDARYFRVFNGPLINNLNLGGLDFWRVSAGLVFR
jgi:hypothetical protein